MASKGPDLHLEDGVMYYDWSYHEGRSRCLVVPESLRQKVLYYCHDTKDSGHLGQSKTLDRLKETFYWYGMTRDSDIYVKQCSVCNKNKKRNRTPRSPLGTYHAGYPMERNHIDILGPFTPSRSGNIYILVMGDQFTKWVELAALPAQNAELTAKAFLDHFVVTLGFHLRSTVTLAEILKVTSFGLSVNSLNSPKQGQPLTILLGMVR